MPSIVNMFVKGALDNTSSCPTLDPKRCLNSKQGKARCRACLDICPGGALQLPEKGKADWEKCVSCGLCSVVCPSGALGATDYRRRKAWQMMNDERPVHIFACQQAGCDADSKAWCLSSFPWELIAGVALHSRVELVQGNCESCPRKDKRACFDEAMERVKLFLGDKRFEEQVSMHGADETSKREVSRRELFGTLIPGARKQPKNTADTSESFGEDGQAMRLMLAKQMERLPNQEERFGWEAPNFTEKCWACGICAKICPNDALAMKEKDGVWRVVCSPILCTGCGVCEVVCPDKGIDGLRPVKMMAGKKRIVHRTQAGVCPECGGAVKPDSGHEICLRCRVTKKKKK